MLDYKIEFMKRKIQEMAHEIGLTFEEVIDELQKRIDQRKRQK